MNYREFLFVLSCLDWKEVEYTVMNDNSGVSSIANSIDEVKTQLDEVYHFDKEFKDNLHVEDTTEETLEEPIEEPVE